MGSVATQVAPLAVERTRKLRTWTIIIATNVLSLLCMIWVLNGAGLSHIWSEVQHMHWGWVAVAVVSNVLVFLLQGWRWKLLLKPVENVPFAQTTEAIYVGMFANEVLPFRAGELIRCFLLSKSSDLPLSVTFASALIERMFDGTWLMVCFFYCLHMGKLPRVLLNGGYILGVMIVFCAAVFASAMYARKQSIDRFFGMAWPHWFSTLIEDLQLIGHSRYLYFSFLVSGVFMLSQVVPVYALVLANGLAVSWKASFVMMVLLRLASIVPQAPGNLGSFQWVAAHTLMMFGLATSHAKRFSLILWAVVTIPLIVVGFIALALEGINMSHLHREATAAASKRKERRH